MISLSINSTNERTKPSTSYSYTMMQNPELSGVRSSEPYTSIPLLPQDSHRPSLPLKISHRHLVEDSPAVKRGANSGYTVRLLFLRTHHTRGLNRAVSVDRDACNFPQPAVRPVMRCTGLEGLPNGRSLSQLVKLQASFEPAILNRLTGRAVYDQVATYA
jgi:hypothetical protein